MQRLAVFRTFGCISRSITRGPFGCADQGNRPSNMSLLYAKVSALPTFRTAGETRVAQQPGRGAQHILAALR
jgi:hypothetical protein